MAKIPVSRKEYEAYCVDRAWEFIIFWVIGSGTTSIAWIAIERGQISMAIFSGLIALGCFLTVILDYLSGPKYVRSLTDEVMKTDDT